jgi:phenylpyruvate tautomerase PptA (4-oxalocrotonate tautomerase family)
MPLWKIFHSPGAFDTEQKAALANDITNLYVEIGLPAFYTNVLFFAVPEESFYVGGKKVAKFVRITVEQIARQMAPDEASRRSWLRRIDEKLAPHIEQRGFAWEYNIVESSRDLWKINGLSAPLPNSDAEKKWAAENRPSAYEQESRSERAPAR